MTPAETFVAACGGSGPSGSPHPYGGLGFLRRGETVCLARINETSERSAEISGMYAPVRGGGRHALGLICLLADLHGVDLELVAVAILPFRRDTPSLVETYSRFGFEAGPPDGSGRVPMKRRFRRILPRGGHANGSGSLREAGEMSPDGANPLPET